MYLWTIQLAIYESIDLVVSCHILWLFQRTPAEPEVFSCSDGIPQRLKSSNWWYFQPRCSFHWPEIINWKDVGSKPPKKWKTSSRCMVFWGFTQRSRHRNTAKKSTNGEKTSLIRFSWQDPAPMHMVNIPSNSAMNMPLVTVRWLLHQLYDQENLALLSALLNSHLGRVYTECYFFQAS